MPSKNPSLHAEVELWMVGLRVQVTSQKKDGSGTIEFHRAGVLAEYIRTKHETRFRFEGSEYFDSISKSTHTHTFHVLEP